MTIAQINLYTTANVNAEKFDSKNMMRLMRTAHHADVKQFAEAEKSLS